MDNDAAVEADRLVHLLRFGERGVFNRWIRRIGSRWKLPRLLVNVELAVAAAGWGGGTGKRGCLSHSSIFSPVDAIINYSRVDIELLRWNVNNFATQLLRGFFRKRPVMNPLTVGSAFLFIFGSKSSDGDPFFYHGVRYAELGIILCAIQSIEPFRSPTI